MTARFLVGDVFDRMAQLEDGSFDLIITSPPFLALRSYLPDGHPDKAKEIGSEPTPAAFLDTMLALTAEWGRLLAPHGSIAIEIGDTYSGSGGAGGDYSDGGLREGQAVFDGSAARANRNGDTPRAARTRTRNPDEAWPLAKSLAMIPELYAASLAYGHNLLTGTDSPAGRWRVRNFKPWIRSNPPVGALGDKERPATSYITVATKAVDRYFDLDDVRTTPSRPREGTTRHKIKDGGDEPLINRGSKLGEFELNNPAGAPPLDWWHHIDAIIDHEIDQRTGKASPERERVDGGGNVPGMRQSGGPATTGQARGVHIRRALERAGILQTHDALDISPKGYKGAHYAVWPPELVRHLINEMCPRRVCTTCGQPSRRLHEENPEYPGRAGGPTHNNGEQGGSLKGFKHQAYQPSKWSPVGWSDCGHGTWRPGRILDPFVGSGTTLAVATGMTREAVGIDIDERNTHLAAERVGMFLTIDTGTKGIPA